MNYIVMNLLEMLDTYGEEGLESFLSNFTCPLNQDVESFIRDKAINFAKQRVVMTYLVFSDEQIPEFAGYFALANKFVSIMGEALSKTMQKRIGKYSQYDEELNRFLVSMPLIAQLGKNYDSSLHSKIAGKELLEIACSKVQDAQYILGGKAVYIECANNPKLFDFYSNLFYKIIRFII